MADADIEAVLSKTYYEMLGRVAARAAALEDGLVTILLTRFNGHESDAHRLLRDLPASKLLEIFRDFYPGQTAAAAAKRTSDLFRKRNRFLHGVVSISMDAEWNTQVRFKNRRAGPDAVEAIPSVDDLRELERDMAGAIRKLLRSVPLSTFERRDP